MLTKNDEKDKLESLFAMLYFTCWLSPEVELNYMRGNIVWIHDNQRKFIHRHLKRLRWKLEVFLSAFLEFCFVGSKTSLKLFFQCWQKSGYYIIYFIVFTIINHNMQSYWMFRNKPSKIVFLKRWSHSWTINGTRQNEK